MPADDHLSVMTDTVGALYYAVVQLMVCECEREDDPVAHAKALSDRLDKRLGQAAPVDFSSERVASLREANHGLMAEVVATLQSKA